MTDQPSTSRARTDPPAWVGVDPSEDDNRPPPLTRPRVVRAALRLVDERGLAALTMRALATELKVSPMALYNHVRDKDELLDLMLDLVLGEVDCSATDGDWFTQLRALVCSFDQALSAHHHIVQVYSTRLRLGPNALTIIERATQLLLRAGFPPPDAAAAFLTLYTYTVGRYLMGRVAPASGTNPQEAEYYGALPAEKIPSIWAVRHHLSGVHAPGQFEYGLDTLLTGLRTKLSQVGGPPPQPRDG